MAATPAPRSFVLALFVFAACAAQAGDKVVTASNYQFTPADTRIVVGETVTWTNAGGMHNVHSTDGLFHNQISTAPWHFNFTFKTPGYFFYICQQHGGAGYGGFNMVGSVTVRASNAPPALVILSPGQGQQYAANDPVTLAPFIQDDGLIDQVEFFDGGASLGVARTSPFNLNVALPPGTHSVRAKATDDHEAVAESSAITFQVEANHRPTVSVTEPTPEQVFFLPAPYAFKVQAADADGDLAKVDYFNQDNTGATKLIGTVTTAPFNLVDPQIPDGVSMLTVVATDAGGLSRTSAPVRFYISRAIMLSIYPNSTPGYVTVKTTPTFGAVQMERSSNLAGSAWSNQDGKYTPGGGSLEYYIKTDLPRLFFRTEVEPQY